MNIKVIGAGCEDCDKLHGYVIEAASELGMEAEIEKVEDLIEIVKLGVMSAPTIMIDGKVVSAGKKLKKNDVVKLLGKYA